VAGVAAKKLAVSFLVVHTPLSPNGLILMYHRSLQLLSTSSTQSRVSAMRLDVLLATQNYHGRRYFLLFQLSSQRTMLTSFPLASLIACSKLFEHRPQQSHIA